MLYFVASTRTSEKPKKNPTILLMEEILHHLGCFWNLVNNGKNLPTSTGIKSKIHVEHGNTSVGFRWTVSRFTPLTLVIFGPTWLLRLDVRPGRKWMDQWWSDQWVSYDLLMHGIYWPTDPKHTNLQWCIQVWCFFFGRLRALMGQRDYFFL